MQVVSDVELNIGLTCGTSRQDVQAAREEECKLVTLPSLRQMVVNIARAIAGMPYGGRPAPVSKLRPAKVVRGRNRLNRSALCRMRDGDLGREHGLAGSGPVLAAVVRRGKSCSSSLPTSGSPLERMLANLRQKDKHWVGIAATSGRGVFSVKGAKEVAYPIYNASTYPANGGHGQVNIH